MIRPPGREARKKLSTASASLLVASSASPSCHRRRIGRNEHRVNNVVVAPQYDHRKIKIKIDRMCDSNANLRKWAMTRVDSFTHCAGVFCRGKIYLFFNNVEKRFTNYPIRAFWILYGLKNWHETDRSSSSYRTNLFMSHNVLSIGVLCGRAPLYSADIVSLCYPPVDPLQNHMSKCKLVNKLVLFYQVIFCKFFKYKFLKLKKFPELLKKTNRFQDEINTKIF